MKKADKQITNADRGIKYHDFDFIKEFIIYKCVCGEKLKNNKWKKLEPKERLYKYADWKLYIENKYKNKSVEDLEEFERFLKYNSRMVKPKSDFWKILMTISLTLFFSMLVNTLLNAQIDFSLLPAKLYLKALFYFIYVVVQVVIFFALIGIISHVTNVIWENALEKYFLEDYEEIIREIINKKRMK